MQLQKKISAIGLLAAAVGGVVGSGWLFGPLYAAQIAGPAAILSWIIGGILMLIIGLTFAELATAFPIAGGMVHFGEMSHGSVVSFAIGWMIWLSSVVVAPIETLALLQYASNYIPDIMQKSAGTAILTHSGMVVAAILMFIMCWLNALSAKFFSKTTTAVAIIKLLVPILTIAVLLHMDFHLENFHNYGGFMPYGWKGVVQALPLGGVVFSFIGYSTAIQLAEEAKNPQRAVPLAIIGTILMCMVLYVLLQLSFIGGLFPQFLMEGWQHVGFAGDNGPFAGILLSIGFVWLVMVIYADAVISPFGTAYIYTAATARVGFALSKINFFPAWVQTLNSHGVPWRAMMVNYGIGLLLFLPFPGWQSLVGFLVSCFVISYIIGPIALYSLRLQQSNQVRPFRLPAFRLLTIVAFYFCNLIIFWTGWDTVWRLLIAISIGFIFFIYRFIRDKQQIWRGHWQYAWWLFVYLIGMGMISYVGSFGGGRNILPFGIDFAVIAGFTIIIFIWAIKTAKR